MISITQQYTYIPYIYIHIETRIDRIDVYLSIYIHAPVKYTEESHGLRLRMLGMQDGPRNPCGENNTIFCVEK